MPKLIVTLPGGIQDTHDTDKWYRRWEPTDEQLENARKNKSANDIPRIAHVQAVDILVVMDSNDKSVVAVYRDWLGFKVVS